MLFQLHSLYAIVASLLLCQVSISSAGHVRLNRRSLRAHQHLHSRNFELNHQDFKNIKKRDGVSSSDVQQLQNEFNAFSQWMNTWFASPNATNTASSIAQVQEEIVAYEGQMTSWLTTASASSSSDVQQLQSEFNVFSTWMTEWFNTANTTDSASSVAMLQQEVQAYEGWLKAWFGAALSNSPSTLPSLATSVPAPTTGSQTVLSVAVSTTATTSIVTQVSTLVVLSSATATLPSTSSPAATSTASAGIFLQSPSTSSVVSSAVASPVNVPASGSNSSSGSGSGFNPKASDNVAVYFGASDSTNLVPLSTLCQNSNIDIVVLAFLNTFFDADGYPGIDFGGACNGQAAQGTTALLSCPEMGAQITACQSAGKKVLLSLGGAASTSDTFASDDQAKTLATMIWNLFGGGTSPAKTRPFGSGVQVDGFDIDTEAKNQQSYTVFTEALRNLYSTQNTKDYYISAAPQCIYPDASIPMDAMQAMDFVFVQFYNNPSCNVGSSGFLASFQQWSSQLKLGGDEWGHKPQLFIGAEASAADGGSYIDMGSMQGVVKSARGAAVGNLGGVMLWDGSQAVANGNYEAGMKSALTN